ncbi:small acidic protein family-domain-containing protein [Thelonectria olida]|uniref:Small acidic protein n=1 Tax=Thelonectria olida TaxID=1576542 RepID=A0A9P9ARV3_9HYPO|nr:small acidic protein family-domain-containing protein [Thelonectria olida]
MKTKKAARAAAKRDNPELAEKHKARLLKRSEKLKLQAQKLLAEAAKAAAQYERIVEKEKQKGAEAGSDSDSSEESDDDAMSDIASDAVASEDEASSEENSENDEGIQEIKPTMDEVPAKFPADEILLKQRRLSNAASERSAGSQESAPAIETKKPKKEKKSKKSEVEEEASSESKPEKKSKKVKAVKQEIEAEAEAEAEPEIDTLEKKTKKEKKAEKKRKRASDAVDASKTDETKKSKKSKAKGGESSSGHAEAEQWQVGDLDGGAARQAKFMRLLGGKKSGASAPAASNVSKGKSDSTKAEADIQRQFEAGMKMKNEGGSKRRGLGA